MSNPNNTYYNPMDNPAYVWHMIMQARKGMAKRNTAPHPKPGPMYGAVDYGPGHRRNCHKQKPQPPCPYDGFPLPNLPTVKTTDTVKVTEIRDVFNNLRYKVVMSSIDGIGNVSLVDPKYSKYYEVEVVNCFSAPNPLVIVHRPSPGEEAINTAEAAQQIFDSYVTAYTNLVKAETKDFQDICTYKEEIGYTMTKPECCATCKWSRLALTENDYVYGVSGRIECTNPANALDYDFNTESQSLRANPKHPPYFKSTNNESKLIVYPNVHAFGKCPKYEADDRDPYIPIPGDSVGDIIDRRTNAAYDDMCQTVQQNISENIGDQVNTAVENATENIGEQIQQNVQDVITQDISQQIEDQLTNGNLVIEGNSQINDYNGDGVIDDADIIISGQGA